MGLNASPTLYTSTYTYGSYIVLCDLNTGTPLLLSRLSFLRGLLAVSQSVSPSAVGVSKSVSVQRRVIAWVKKAGQSWSVGWSEVNYRRLELINTLCYQVHV